MSILLHQVPFVDEDNDALVVASDQGKNIDILSLTSCLRINHEQADIGIFNGPYGTHYRIKLNVFAYLTLFADTGGIHQEKVVTEFIVSCIYGVACRSGHRRYNMPFLSQ